MATRLAEMPPKRGRGHVHPWEEWTDGSVWRIERGADYPGKTDSLRVRLYSKARELGKELDIQYSLKEDWIIFQFKDAEGDEK